MPVEIGSLIVRGTFGNAAREEGPSSEEMRAEIQRLRRELRREMREMLDDAQRRARER